MGRLRSEGVKRGGPQRREFVIGGFIEPDDERPGCSDLLLGYFGEDGRLHYAGKVGVGLAREQRDQLELSLQQRERMVPAFVEPPAPDDLRRARWVAPELVAEIEFDAWTAGGQLRRPSFQGLREDLPAREITADALER